jgi:hypothetical protein
LSGTFCGFKAKPIELLPAQGGRGSGLRLASDVARWSMLTLGVCFGFEYWKPIGGKRRAK